MTNVSESSPSLGVRASRIDTGLVIEASGDLDLSTIHAFEEQYHRSLDDLKAVGGDKTLILDFRELIFIDSAGLALLIGMKRELAAIEKELVVLIAPGTQLQRVFKIGQFHRLINIKFNLADAD